jgi:hypothetical protein
MIVVTVCLLFFLSPLASPSYYEIRKSELLLTMSLIAIKRALEEKK